MKKRRNLLVALLLVVAMVVGVGYAAIARDLVVSSDAQLTADSNNFDVVFTDAKITSMTVKGSSINVADTNETDPYASITMGGAHNVSYNIEGFTAKNDTVTFRVTIKNQNATLKAKLSTISLGKGNLILGTGAGAAGSVDFYFTKTVKVNYKDSTNADQIYTYTKDGTNDSTKTDYDQITTADIILDPNETITADITVSLNEMVGANGEASLTLTGATVYFTLTPFVD